MASVRVVAALLLVMLAVARGQDASVQPPSCEKKCPGGLQMIDDANDPTKCGYQCCSPEKPFCLPPLNKAFCCGGTTKVRCLAIACTKSFSYANAGPGGCASAGSTIAASSISDTAYDSYFPKQYYKDTDLCVAKPEDTAYRWANAYAKAIAYTLIQYYTYACTCCVGNSKAYSSVAANVQAVATAVAKACQEAVLLGNCGGEPLGGASAQLGALAKDTQLAIDKVFQDVVSKNGWGKNGCDVEEMKKQVEKAVAEAAACTFFKFIITFYKDEAKVYACDKTFAIANPQNPLWFINCLVPCQPVLQP